jgi:hypothetical protein
MMMSRTQLPLALEIGFPGLAFSSALPYGTVTELKTVACPNAVGNVAVDLAELNTDDPRRRLAGTLPSAISSRHADLSPAMHSDQTSCMKTD